MANYIALDSYSVFTPPKNQFFHANTTSEINPIEIQPSPAATVASQVGSQSDNYAVESVGVSSDPSYDHYLKSRQESDSTNYGYYSGSPSQAQSPQPFIPRSLSDSQVKSHSETPALSQMYAMKRK